MKIEPYRNAGDFDYKFFPVIASKKPIMLVIVTTEISAFSIYAALFWYMCWATLGETKNDTIDTIRLKQSILR